MSKTDGFKVIEHLSDVAIKAYAKRIEKLFEMVAMGMASILSDPGHIQSRIQKQIHIKREEAANLEDLLVLWLEKILYLHESQNIVFSGFKISKIDLDSEVSLSSEIFGEHIDLRKHDIHTHIKAPTYHYLQIIRDKKKDRFFVEIIFDI